ncbi:MAG: sigma 54-interacting transcriptional regulator [Desulfobulbaceae bacterium]|uniref:Sigma 54-interacting transcriptional regulator n=1 Tax=Candidatus Desulfobia pelagia TaxID=2841692 RepID=A0A8J6NF15_9BACT|nr:sigma 54-interacting transcriptional regulator [Candidatus Desulfobia pelagia]
MNPHNFFTLNNIAVSEILNGVPHGIAVVDTDLRLVEMNHSLESHVGCTTTAACGVFVDSILRSSLGHNNQVFHDVLESGVTVSFEGDIINKHHKKIPIQFTASPLKDHNQNTVGIHVLLEDISYLQSVDQKQCSKGCSAEIIGHSPKMQEIFDLMPVLAQTDASILITGETGTGKDMLAEEIHKRSKRSRYPFIKINCGALPESLLESELFGHVRGAFTGAVKDKPGMFRLAQDGTIFLTEIGDLPLPLQVKLLSVLDDKEFFPVGGSHKVKVDVRVIAATHRSLRELVSQGKFREDLFYRLNVLRLYLPSLKERDGDIRLLLDYFFRKINENLNKKIKGFSPKTIEILTSYTYPGNVRELRNIVEYGLNICQGRQITPENLPKYMFTPIPAMKKKAAREEKNFELPRKAHLPVADTPKQGGWTAIEKELILDALKSTRGNRSEAAKLLGWGRTTLWRKIIRHGLA